MSEATLAFARLAEPVDFGAKDGPADLVFMIAAPAAGDEEHLRLLTKLARALVRKDLTDALRSVSDPGEVVALVSGVMSPAPCRACPVGGWRIRAAAAATAAAASTVTTDGAASSGTTAGSAPSAATATASGAPTPAAAGAPDQGHLVAVTSCPTGIAHTYMAAEALEAAGTKAGVPVRVEPQGSAGAEPLDREIIRAARRHLRHRRRCPQQGPLRRPSGDQRQRQERHPRRRRARRPCHRGR